MKVCELRDKLKNLPPDLEVGVKWLNAIRELKYVGARKVGKGFQNTKRGRTDVVLLSPFDIEVGSREY